ncbi:Na+/H+ antiporter [Chloroflexi bacterium TSY]|nr:Na+/H+ antiporter [Chloroflexi bacterium TSY]
MDELLQVELQVVVVMMIAASVAVLTRYIRIPYTVALVLAGLAISFQDTLRIEMTPNLVLAFLVPPLLFEAALHVELNRLRADIMYIMSMAVPGVLISAFSVAGILSLTGILSFPVALLFGALISATDPVAVVATFRAVGAPKRLTILMEGESLFNDGTAVVLFNVVLAVVVASVAGGHGHEFSLSHAITEFVVEVAGGLLVGVVLGFVAAELIARIDDYLIEITLTTIAAYGSYLLADSVSIAGFHFSGVLAVVAAGLVNGNYGPRGMSPTTRIVLFNFWEYLAFLANSLVFVLIGMNVRPELLLQFSVPALLAVVAVLASRAINVYGLGGLVRSLQPTVPIPYLHIMYWGGLRGAISLAMALSIPLVMGDIRNELLAMTFAVVLFTLLIQATTIPSLLERLNLTKSSTTPIEYERLQGKLLATHAARRHLDHLFNEGALVPQAWEQVKSELDSRDQELSAATSEMLAQHPELQQKIVHLARLETLRAERAALDDLAQEGLLSSEALAELQAEIDAAIISPTAGMIALDQEQDQDPEMVEEQAPVAA